MASRKVRGGQRRCAPRRSHGCWVTPTYAGKEGSDGAASTYTAAKPSGRVVPGERTLFAIPKRLGDSALDIGNREFGCGVGFKGGVKALIEGGTSVLVVRLGG